MKKIGIKFKWISLMIMIDWAFLDIGLSISWRYGFSIMISILFFVFEISFGKYKGEA